MVVQLGYGLETTYSRCDNGHTRWYALDMPHVVEYRRALLSEPERETYLAGDAFAEDWIRQIRCDVRMLLFWSPPEACSTILRKTRLWASCGCSRGLERLKSSLTP